MRPWEKRLKDLSRLLANCHDTYLDPDLFRMNTNQFLQTSRTVTFIIQKNKDSIPDYGVWYPSAVLEPWRNDEVMNWAKEARNTIEKEGDLELNSSLKLTLLFSYLSEQDCEIQCGRAELLSFGVTKLVRLAQKSLPTGVSDAAVVKIERRWVTALLPQWELLQALVYVYARVHECCQSLACQFGESIDEGIPAPSDFSCMQEETRQVSYFKLNGLRSYSMKTEVVPLDRQFRPPAALKTVIASNAGGARSFDELVHGFAEMAEATFSHYGNHISLLLLFNEDYQVTDLISTAFADQADKYIFWRYVADRIVTLHAHGLIWISELWLRRGDRSGATAIRNLPITGERLHVVAVSKSDGPAFVEWDILRSQDDARPTLQPVSPEDRSSRDGLSFFLAPAMRALGLDNAEFTRPGTA